MIFLRLSFAILQFQHQKVQHFITFKAKNDQRRGQATLQGTYRESKHNDVELERRMIKCCLKMINGSVTYVS